MRPGRAFPQLGSRHAPVSVAARAPFFVTGPHVRVVSTDDGSQVLEGSPFHAKRMGTTVTMCGKSALAWRKLWHIPFQTTSSGQCPVCVDVVRRTSLIVAGRATSYEGPDVRSKGHDASKTTAATPQRTLDEQSGIEPVRQDAARREVLLNREKLVEDQERTWTK